LLRYFGEEYGQPSCNGCDNCLTPRETFDGTIPAQKFLSCVHRICAKSGFGFGLNHVVEVLTAADTQAIRQRRHDQLSTYGSGHPSRSRSRSTFHNSARKAALAKSNVMKRYSNVCVPGAGSWPTNAMCLRM